MDTQLPKGLESALTWILSQYNVHSWRIIHENKLTLSIRFIDDRNAATSTPQPVLQQTTSDHQTVYRRCYRRKPPCSQYRDIKRAQAWNNINNSSQVMCEGDSIRVDNYDMNGTVTDHGYNSELYSAGHGGINLNVNDTSVNVFKNKGNHAHQSERLINVMTQTQTINYDKSSQIEEDFSLRTTRSVEIQCPRVK